MKFKVGDHVIVNRRDFFFWLNDEPGIVTGIKNVKRSPSTIYTVVNGTRGYWISEEDMVHDENWILDKKLECLDDLER